MFSCQSSYIPTLVMSHSWFIIQGDRRGNARASGQITSNFLTQASWRLYEIRQPSTSLCTTSNFRDGTGRGKLTFKLDFPGNLWLTAFSILAISYIFCKRFPMCVRPSYLPVQLTRQDQRRGNAERKTNAIGSLHPFSNQKRKETLTWLLTETSQESSQVSWTTP